jgi:hypothetical protein
MTARRVSGVVDDLRADRLSDLDFVSAGGARILTCGPRTWAP